MKVSKHNEGIQMRVIYVALALEFEVLRDGRFPLSLSGEILFVGESGNVSPWLRDMRHCSGCAVFYKVKIKYALPDVEISQNRNYEIKKLESSHLRKSLRHIYREDLV